MIQSYLIKNAHLEEHSVKTGCQLFLLEASKLVLVLRWQTGLIELSLFVFFFFLSFLFHHHSRLCEQLFHVVNALDTVCFN